jgi:outer membrane protein assembly factor BamB
LLLTMTMSGCSSVPSTPKEVRTEQTQPAAQPPDKPSPVDAPPAAPLVQPVWTYDAPGAITSVLTSGREIRLLIEQQKTQAWLRLDSAGKAVAPPLSLGGRHRPFFDGRMGSVTPDFSRILVYISNTEAKVIDRSGQTLWHGLLPQTKVGSQIYLLPDGKTLLTTVVTEHGDGVSTTAMDLSGRLLWELHGDQAGGLYYASDKELILGNYKAVWRMGVDGKGRKDLPVWSLSLDSLEVSADGSTIARMGDKEDMLFDREGQLLAKLPSVEIDILSRDGQRVLVNRGKGAYALLDRQGREVWHLSFPGGLTARALSPDGALFLAVRQSQSDESLLATLYDRTGKPVWQSKLAPIPDFRSPGAEAAIDAENRLAYVIANNRLFALPLQAP